MFYFLKKNIKSVVLSKKMKKYSSLTWYHRDGLLGGIKKMNSELLVVLYFFVVVIVVLTLVIVRDKQFLRTLLEKKELHQEEITDLKLEKVRLKHIIKMQDETITHMLNSSPQYSKQIELEYSKNAIVEEHAPLEWDLGEYESMNQEYYQS